MGEYRLTKRERTDRSGLNIGSQRESRQVGV
jgi:hypothetical protein